MSPVLPDPALGAKENPARHPPQDSRLTGPAWHPTLAALSTVPFMANIRSAEKDIRKTKVRTAHNQTVKSRIRTLRKKVLAAVESKDAAAAAATLSEFSSAADKAAKTNVLKKNTSSRLKSRLALKVGALTK
jgi:small subunit ribosomal protein S20